MKYKRLSFSLIFLLIYLLPALLHAQNRQYWLKREFPHLIVEEKLWIGTPKGLYQYHDEDDTWTFYGEHSGLPSNDIRILLWDGEFLWAATTGGIAYGDIKLNKWLMYTFDNGLSGTTIHTIADQEDYVWVGTDKGAARFDKLIQEWELFTTVSGLPDSTVYDIAVDGDLVYFATAGGLAEYDTGFEKWRYYGVQDGIASDVIHAVYPTTDFLWLFTDRGLSRFSKKLHTSLSFTDDPRLHYRMIRDLKVDNEQFWLGTDDGVVIYDPGSNMWRNFQEEMNLPDKSVKAMSFSQDKRWFVTEQGIAAYDEAFRSWQRYDRTHGLTSENYDEVTEYKGMVFLINEDTIDYFKQSENRWYVYPIKDVTAGKSDMSSYISLDRGKGSFIQINPDVRFSMSGSRFTYRHQRSYTHSYDTHRTDNFTESLKRGDIKAQLSMPEGRTVNGFYNDTDFSRVLYGIRFRGNESDIVQEANWGDVRYEQGKNNLVPSVEIFGTSARLEAGPETKRFKRSLVSAKGWSGEKTTGFETDFFIGNFTSGGITIQDVDYIKNSYFRLSDTIDGYSADKGSETVYMDDGISGNNTANTMTNFTAGGVTGDFDRLQSFIDYTVDYEKGEVRFVRPVSDNAVIVVQGTENGIPFERIIKKPGEIDHSLINRYFIGGMEIFPHSFVLEIFDSQGSRHPLREFALDNDNDGKVDPESIDYREGILTFPGTEPFPLSVYDPDNPQSQFTMKISFQSEIRTFNLSHNHLIRGSEVCIVDGEILAGGENYVLDYTSGTLLIIKEGVVAEDSELEIRYDYYRDTTEKFNFAGAGYSTSDNMQMELNYYSFDRENKAGNAERFNGVNYFGEFRRRVNNLDIKFTPEFARTGGTSQDGSGMHLRTDASSDKIRLFSEYERYDRGFTPMFDKKFQLGNLHDRLAAGGTVYPLEYLDVNADWSRQSTPSAENGNKSVEENRSGKILFSKVHYPALSFSARRRILETGEYNSLRDIVKGDLEYNVPGDFLKRVSLKSARVYAVWRRSSEDKKWLEANFDAPDTKKSYDNHYLRFDVAPMNLVQINSYYRGKSVRGRDTVTGTEDNLFNKYKKLFFDVTVDRIRGLNMNVRSEGETTESYPSSGTDMNNRYLYRSLQSNLRLFPGQWFQALTPFTFEVNYQPSWRGYLRNTGRKLSVVEKFLYMSRNDDITSSEDNKLYQIRGEWRPAAALFFYVGYDIYDITSQHLSSRLNTDIRRINHKTEYRPTMYSLMTFQYIRNHEEKARYSTMARDNPMIWFENRWNEKLQTKFNVSYLREKKETGKIRETSSTLSPLLGLTYRIFRQGTGDSKAEIRNDLSFSFYRSDSRLPGLSTNGVSNAFAVDYFPVSVLTFRFRIITSYKDQTGLSGDTLSNMLELRLTAQF